MKKHRKIFWGLTAFLGVCVLLSWLTLLLWETPAMLPLSTAPILVMAGGLSSVWALVGCAAVILALYVLTFLFLRGACRAKRYGSVGIILIFTLDLAVNVIFTATTWWFLAAVGLDIAVIAAQALMVRWAETNV